MSHKYKDPSPHPTNYWLLVCAARAMARLLARAKIFKRSESEPARPLYSSRTLIVFFGDLLSIYTVLKDSFFNLL